MTAATSNSPAYLAHGRGNRTAPGRSHPRYVVLTLLLERLTAIVDSDWLPRATQVLDYGCGNRPYASLFRTKFTDYIGADFSGNPDADVILGDDGELPLADGSVDCVLSTQVLEHVQHPDLYLAEAHRVLRPGGALVLSTHGVWPYHPDPGDYWRWTIDGLQLQVYRAGFDLWALHSVLGLASSSLQLWQDATSGHIPTRLRPVYFWLIQWWVGRIERRRVDEISSNAAVYIVFAKKGPRRESSVRTPSKPPEESYEQ
jgi:SAM-dependent methyltransferase